MLIARFFGPGFSADNGKIPTISIIMFMLANLMKRNARQDLLMLKITNKHLARIMLPADNF